MSLIVVLWLLLSATIALDVERRAARRQERPLRRWLVLIHAIGLTLGVIAAVLIGLRLVA
jgi:hypothetical protein